MTQLPVAAITGAASGLTGNAVAAFALLAGVIGGGGTLGFACNNTFADKVSA
jgi:hypothetical protein